MNNNGQIMIMDLLFYLIIITLILSAIVFSTATINDNQVTKINNRELNRILESSADTLTKTSGNPENWEKISSNVKNVGLKSQNNSLLSYDKITKLKSNPQLVNDYFPNNIAYSITIYPKTNPNNKELIAGTSYLANKNQIKSKTVPFIFDYDFSIISFNQDNESCPYLHDNEWICKCFTLNKTLLSEGRYYIITDSKTNYILSNSYSKNISGQTNNRICINKQLERLLIGDNETIYVHSQISSNNTYLVYDGNDREEYLDSIIRPEIYLFNIKIAI